MTRTNSTVITSTMSVPTISQLFYYPLKSASAIGTDLLEFESPGPKFDREFLLIDTKGQFLTQRQYPQMARIKVELNKDQQSFSFFYPGMPPLNIFPRSETGGKKEVSIWNHRGIASTFESRVNEWFSESIGISCEFVETGSHFTRFNRPKDEQSFPTSPIRFVDSSPVLLILEESLIELNNKFHSKIPIDRFRGNIIVRGGSSFEDDHWTEIQIGQMKFRKVKKCSRCQIIDIEQKSGEIKRDNLKNLAKYRKENKKVFFGTYWTNLNNGFIKRDDSLTIVS